MIFVESPLCYRRSRSGHTVHGAAANFQIVHLPRLNLAHIARHQLDPRIIKSFPALVVHGDPAHQVNDIAFIGSDDVVVRFPGQPPSNVGKLGANRPSLIRRQQPLECRLEDRLIAQ